MSILYSSQYQFRPRTQSNFHFQVLAMRFNFFILLSQLSKLPIFFSRTEFSRKKFSDIEQTPPSTTAHAIRPMNIPVTTRHRFHARRDRPCRRGGAPLSINTPTPSLTAYQRQGHTPSVQASSHNSFMPFFHPARVGLQNIPVFSALVAAYSFNQTLVRKLTQLLGIQDSVLLSMEKKKSGLTKASNQHKS